MKEKQKKITIKILAIIPSLMALFFIDLYIFPQKTINDEIIAYGEITLKNNVKYNSRGEFVGYKFYTAKNFSFGIKKTFIKENNITIKHTYIFKSITGVNSITKDYTDKLITGIKGLPMFLYTILTITASISLVVLFFYKNLSENGFHNIILINSFLAFFTIYFYSIYN